jgi:hypothetical protein
MSVGLCIFCLRSSGAPSWVLDRPGLGCTYGLAHEYLVALAKAPALKARDMALCVHCGLHPKNPAASRNGCEHQYEAS